MTGTGAKSRLAAVFGPSFTSELEADASEMAPVPPECDRPMAGGRGKSRLDAVFGPDLQPADVASDAPEMTPVSPECDGSSKTIGQGKSRLDAVIGLDFQPDAASANLSQSLDGGSFWTGGDDSGLPLSMNTCGGSICGCETCRLLKAGVSSNNLSALNVSTSSLSVENLEKVPLLSTKSDSSTGGGGSLNTLASSGLSDGEPTATASRTNSLEGRITDGILEVEDIVSTLEKQFKEALDIEEPIPVRQRLGSLQEGVRMLSLRLDVTRPADQELPDSEQHMAHSSIFSRIEQKLQDLSEKIGLNNNAVSKEEFEEFRIINEEALKSIHNALDCNHNFQVQVHQRMVPRIILCSKRKGAMYNLLTLPGVKSLRLHMLCEQEDEEHKVEGATGCELRLKKGETWDAIYPFLHNGLMLLQAVTNIAGRVLAVDSLVPSAHSWIQEFNSNMIEDDARFHSTYTPQAAAKAASSGAEQWLVNHLTGRDIMEDFGLQRMVFEESGSQPKGSIVWLCKQHAESGKDSEVLTHLPIPANK